MVQANSIRWRVVGFVRRDRISAAYSLAPAPAATHRPLKGPAMDATEKLPTRKINDLERLALTQGLNDCGWNRIATAVKLGKSVRWVRYRIIQFGLRQSLQSSPKVRGVG